MTGVMIRSRAKWYEEGEKSSNYFANLEKRNFTNKSILELEKNDGETIKDQAKILNEVKNFYQNLNETKNMTNDNTNLSELLNHCSFRKLTDLEKEGLEGQITQDEILTALKQTKNNTSPG
ncbi:hypothetical protein SNE40_001518 [Patella caerulea]|uniref:Uncharacterized protein n=1 Tax=Patella caerulea TaxID=87958 RepID=A0AAN8KNX8_PATCE